MINAKDFSLAIERMAAGDESAYIACMSKWLEDDPEQLADAIEQTIRVQGDVLPTVFVENMAKVARLAREAVR